MQPSNAATRSVAAAPALWYAALSGLSALLLGIGLSRFGYPPLIPALVKAGWFSVGQADYLGATTLAGYIFGAGFTAPLARRLPPYALMRAAMVVGSLSFVACAFPLDFAWYAVWRFASGVIGGVLMVLAAPLVLAITPEPRRGRVAGVIFTGVGIGIALSGTLVPWLVRFGLRDTWLCFGAAGAMLTAFTWRGFPMAPVVPIAARARRPAGRRFSFAVVLLIVAYGCNALGFVPHTVFWVDYIARGLHQGLAAGSFYWVLLGLAAAGGPVAAGFLADRIGFRSSLRLCLLAMAAAVALPLISSGPLALALSSLGVGGLEMGITSLASGRVGDLVPAQRQREIWAWMTMVFSVVYAGGAYGEAYLFVRTGSYDLLFAIGAAALFAGAVADLAEPPQRPARG